MNTGVGSLEDVARKRKERLAAMKRKQNDEDQNPQDNLEEPVAKLKPPDISTEEQTSIDPKKEAVFKNYAPEDKQLQDKIQPSAELAQVKDLIADQLKAAKPEPVVEEIDLNNLAPRKPDWDLKRDVANKLAKLEKRTQRAIAELIRERLQEGEGDLALAVEGRSDRAAENEDSD